VGRFSKAVWTVGLVAVTERCWVGSFDWEEER